VRWHALGAFSKGYD